MDREGLLTTSFGVFYLRIGPWALLSPQIHNHDGVWEAAADMSSLLEVEKEVAWQIGAKKTRAVGD